MNRIRKKSKRHLCQWPVFVGIQVLIFLFLTNCSWDKTIVAVKELFMKSSSCEAAQKTISKDRKLSVNVEKKLKVQADNCLKEGEVQQSVFILEWLLKRLKKQKSRVTEIKELEKKLAGLFFDKLRNYEKALKYYVRLLTKPLNPGEKFYIQYHIADSYFHLKKSSQALKEVEKCFFEGISISEEKQASLLKGRIFIAQQQFAPALLFFEKQIEKFPEGEDFFREYLAFVYEAKKDFLSAVKELEKIDQPNAFIREKIRRLLNRQNNQPGF